MHSNDYISFVYLIKKKAVLCFLFGDKKNVQKGKICN